jgi:hypothetical protein
MNCERFQTIVADLARSENQDTRWGIPAGVVVIDANDRAEALAHVDNCSHCGQMLTDQTDLSEMLWGAADRLKFLQAPAHVEQQLLATFRAQTHLHSRPSSRPHWRYWVSAAAAVLLVTFGLLAWRWYVASTRQSPAQANSKSAIAPPSQAPKQEQVLPVKVAGIQSTTAPPVQSSNQTGHRSAPKTSSARRHPASSQLAKRAGAKPSIVEPASAVATNAETREVVTEFISVGYGSALDLQDGGQLVRVELPRSALARFGLPVNMNRVDEKVKADVLVGADGLARAIRFVQ